MSEPEEDTRVEVNFMDIQGIGALPESANKMAGLLTKAAMGAFLAYFSLQELLIELKTYKQNLAKTEGLHGQAKI